MEKWCDCHNTLPLVILMLYQYDLFFENIVMQKMFITRDRRVVGCFVIVYANKVSFTLAYNKASYTLASKRFRSCLLPYQCNQMKWKLNFKRENHAVSFENRNIKYDVFEIFEIAHLVCNTLYGSFDGDDILKSWFTIAS